jgi:hypothetical protein
MKPARKIKHHNSDKSFKRCPLCSKEWKTIEAFLGDGHVRLSGYQWNKKKIREGHEANGLLLFSHSVMECGTTLAIFASDFKDAHKIEQAVETFC